MKLSTYLLDLQFSLIEQNTLIYKMIQQQLLSEVFSLVLLSSDETGGSFSRGTKCITVLLLDAKLSAANVTFS